MPLCFALVNPSDSRSVCTSSKHCQISTHINIGSFIDSNGPIKVYLTVLFFNYFQFILLESFRSIGLSLLCMNVLPNLDLPRCILLGASFHCAPYLQHIFRCVRRSSNPNYAIGWRFLQIMSSIPSAILFAIIFSGSYIWCLMRGHSNFYFGLLPLSFFLCTTGHWESWVDTQHTSGVFQELYEVLSLSIRNISNLIEA